MILPKKIAKIVKKMIDLTFRYVKGPDVWVNTVVN